MSVVSGKAVIQAGALIFITMLAVNAPLSAQEFDRGQALYDNHCKECHEGLAHTRKGSRITSLHDIRTWVASWSAHSQLDWSAEEVEDVADYLNRQFYHLTDKP
jgi:mono/diheme cytochrome c family protein